MIVSKFCNTNEISLLSYAFAGACGDGYTISSDRIDYPCGESGSGNRNDTHGLRCSTAVRTSDLEVYIHIIRLRRISDKSVLKVRPGDGDDFHQRALHDPNHSFFRRSDGRGVMIPADLYLVRPRGDTQP